jgi:hypothetical protein
MILFISIRALHMENDRGLRMSLHEAGMFAPEQVGGRKPVDDRSRAFSEPGEGDQSHVSKTELITIGCGPYETRWRIHTSSSR